MAKVLNKDEFEHMASMITSCDDRIFDLIATIRAKDEIIAARFKEFETLYDAARDFLQAFRAHNVFDRTEEYAVTANRLIEAEKRLSEVLVEGEK